MSHIVLVLVVRIGFVEIVVLLLFETTQKLPCIKKLFKVTIRKKSLLTYL